MDKQAEYIKRALIQHIDQTELKSRIFLNEQRLSQGDYYKIEQVFSPKDYDWYADKEGRALLAFASHYKINGIKIPCMEQMLEQMPEHLNKDGYFGPIFAHKIHEQQLSGHSWILRGLCEHYELFQDDYSRELLCRIVDNLYLPKAGRFSSYPVERDAVDTGDVSGSEMGTVSDWILSTDIGCAFMSIDGLSHAYCILNDPRIQKLIGEMMDVYLKIDKVRLKAQTHCTLTAGRGMIRMYEKTGKAQYLKGAMSIFDLYTNGGMTATYQNLNWWCRPDSWTEPCAIIDSLILAGQLYKATGNEKYRVFAARIYHNGLATAQRSNGGAGVDSIVLECVNDFLYAKLYEAEFCCSMRLAEGLWYINENRQMLYAQLDGTVSKRGNVYMDGDLIYAEVTGGAEAYADKTVTIDGHTLSPIVKYYRVPDDITLSSKQRIVF